ncbi:MAG TPA: GEVED domain-containing protein, partial [Thermoanaerobaculia bacterium]
MCPPFEYSRKRIALLFLVALWIATAAPLLAQPSVTIVKSTNGQDANAPPGPVVTVGSTVTWTYVITNSGGRDLINVAVTDDQIGAVSCPATTLPAGTSMTCTATGTAAAGQYTNIGTVNADEMGGGPVTASDSSHYFGQPAGLITLVKATNGQDANLPPGPSIAVGAAVNWTYVVTNAGSQSITNVAVTDDQGVVVTCPQNTLAASQSMTCTASGTAIAGQYSNIGTATATHPTFGTIVASDPSHYFGQTQNFDFGDAPDSYGTTFAVNGAHHAVGTNVYLGACVDQELDGQPSAAANGDDANAGTSFGTCAVAGADEDGVTFNSSLTVGQPASITVVANAPCTLSAWIDFNINGNFSDPSDALFSSGVNLVAGSNPLMFTVPSTAAGGSTYARFRCTTDGVVGPLGAARDGEVEDYRVTIVPVADLSITKTDAPDPVT